MVARDCLKKKPLNFRELFLVIIIRIFE
ncbi:hypothetical protein Rmet_6734 (plasmid) [Cupriavidus metallidurans CH34]|uniref:Uncharacterized protein n=1 Tax=Cupriavidus metallidurans (strain ATCC 43123 / DSM 2839 / NBRC 102507 / CH34) TaxID=266264 RepID=D3DYE3_CUPMC|nr:hypothetical protein Rmet_6734 [Cupriavidus metallidurans CH34]